ncbi:MAG: hypothetical protein KC776_01545 [Myxococcales bacterium]|nr:hypothetical protein [Myxococcales bacterium]MCB9583299.1 hypothetical protein [Polyangiaceae bacterium]
MHRDALARSANTKLLLQIADRDLKPRALSRSRGKSAAFTGGYGGVRGE